jgi:hypothetical protein
MHNYSSVYRYQTLLLNVQDFCSPLQREKEREIEIEIEIEIERERDREIER